MSKQTIIRIKVKAMQKGRIAVAEALFNLVVFEELAIVAISTSHVVSLRSMKSLVCCALRILCFLTFV